MSNRKDYADVHALAQFFAVRINSDGIVLLANDYKSAIANYPSSAMIILLETRSSALSIDEKSNLPENAGHF
jgi:hypothetical protein